MRIGYLECFSGISGDMLLGALVDAGVSFDLLAETATALNVGARLELRKVMRGGLSATKVDVLTEEQGASHPNGHTSSAGDPGREQGSKGAEPAHSHSHSHEPHTHEHHAQEVNLAPHTHEHTHAPHRSLSAILAIIGAAPISAAVKERACRAFQLLGEVEAAIHSIPIENVHFHEVGAVDTIADIVCTAAGCEALGVNRWMASALNLGSGTVRCLRRPPWRCWAKRRFTLPGRPWSG